uniref:Ionotropic receptor 75a N-terminal domain-containing protein n=1 Tax=Anopheles culicifacies TaxID=139723 RepID=A0A182MCC2_9DIPT
MVYHKPSPKEFLHLLHGARNNCSPSMSFVNVASFSEQKFVTSLEPVHVRVGLMADMTCQGVNSVLPTLAERGYFNGERYRWFLFGLRAIEENRMVLRKLNITVSANVLLLLPIGAISTAVLDVRGQWMGRTWDVSFLQIGSWSMATGFILWNNRSVYENQMNLFGMQLTGVSKTRIIYGNRTLDDEMGTNRAFGHRLWNVLSMVHNISITEDLSTNYDDQLADLIIEPVTINQRDLRKLDYTAAVQHTQTFKYELELERTTVHRDRENGILVLVLGILCQQGFIESSRTYASRLTLFTMLIFSVLIYQFYLTHIVSYLLVVPPKNIRTVEQLAEHGYGVALENVPEFVEFLNATEDEYLLALVQSQQARMGTVYYDLNDGISFILERGRNAFVCDANRAYQLIKHHFTDEQRCALQEIPLMDKLPTHLALRKDHPLKEQLRVTVQKIIATSMVRYERQRSYADKPRCAENEVKMPEVNLDQVSSVMVLLLGTIVGSIGVLLLEITVSKVLKRRRH